MQVKAESEPLEACSALHWHPYGRHLAVPRINAVTILHPRQGPHAAAELGMYCLLSSLSLACCMEQFFEAVQLGRKLHNTLRAQKKAHVSLVSAGLSA